MDSESGQSLRIANELRGTVFVDIDGDGVAGPADERLEGQMIELIALDAVQGVERRTASFGQFGFSDLSPGRYELRVQIGWDVYSVGISIDPGMGQGVKDIAIPASWLGLDVQQQAARGSPGAGLTL